MNYKNAWLKITIVMATATLITGFSTISFSNSNQSIKLKTLKIRGNKELPKILYIVPWKTNAQIKGKPKQQKLVLHSLYGDIFDPIKPRLSKQTLTDTVSSQETSK